MALKSIQEIYLNITNAISGVAVIPTPVNPINTYVILAGVHRTTTGLPEWRRSIANIQLSANGGAITLSTGTVVESGITNKYKIYVIEDDECEVQHYYTTNKGNYPVSISAVNANNTVVISNIAADTGSYPNNHLAFVYLASTSSVDDRLARDFFGGEFSHQVIENPNWYVQTISGTFTSATTSAAISIPITVDANKSWVYGRYFVSAATDYAISADHLWNYQISPNGDKINLFRDEANNDTWLYNFYVISGSNLRVQRGNIAVGSLIGSSATISAVATSASFVNVGSIAGFNTQNNTTGDVWNCRNMTTTELINSTTVSAYRSNTGADEVVSYFEIVEYIPYTPTPPIPPTPPDYNWNIDRNYRIPISAGSLIPSSETNVPMYYNLSNLSGVSAFWSNIQSNGGDLLVTSSDGSTQLPLEIVWISAVSAQGEIYFKDTGSLLTSASSTKNIYYLYFGNTSATQPSVSSTYGRNNVWTEYSAVFHMNDTSNSVGNAIAITTSASSPSAGTNENKSSYWFDGVDDSFTVKNIVFSNIRNMTWETFINFPQQTQSESTIFGTRTAADGIPSTMIQMRDGNGAGSTPAKVKYHWDDQSYSYHYNPGVAVGQINTWLWYGLRIGNSATFRTSGFDTTNSASHSTDTVTSLSSTSWAIGNDLAIANRIFKGYIGELRWSTDTKSTGWTTIQENMFNRNAVFWSTSTSVETRTPISTRLINIRSILRGVSRGILIGMY